MAPFSFNAILKQKCLKVKPFFWWVWFFMLWSLIYYLGTIVPSRFHFYTVCTDINGLISIMGDILIEYRSTAFILTLVFVLWGAEFLSPQCNFTADPQLRCFFKLDSTLYHSCMALLVAMLHPKFRCHSTRLVTHNAEWFSCNFLRLWAKFQPSLSLF